MIRAEKISIPVVSSTHPGMSGKNNEDNFAVTAFYVSENDQTTSLLAVISDGVGGHLAGEIASEMAVNIVSNEIAKSNTANPTQSLINAIKFASQEIFSAAQSGSGRLGMGATVACVWLIGNRLYTATVGDSRIYLIRERSIRQLSIDHTWIQEALELGVIKPDEVQGHPNSHVIRRYLGSPEPPEVDVRINCREGHEPTDKCQGELLLKGDILLLCTDGLTDLVSDAELLVEFIENSQENAVQNLIDLANNRGGHDNITIISARIPDGSSQQKTVHNAKNLKIGCIIAAGLALITALILMGGLLFSRQLLSSKEKTLLSSTPTPGESYHEEEQQDNKIPKPYIFTASPSIMMSSPTQSDNNSTLTPWPTHTDVNQD